MLIGSSFWAASIHLLCICPSDSCCLSRCLRLRGESGRLLRESAGFVLGLAFAGCLLALTLGVLLAYGSGNSGPAVTRHMAGGIALTIGVLACWLDAPIVAGGKWLLCLSCFAHLHVAAALVDYPPRRHALARQQLPDLNTCQAGLKRWVPSDEKTPPDSFYAKQINPIFDSNCVACHGEGKTKGGLRLDSFEQLMKGGKDGVVVVAGDAERSILLTRVTLPSNHKQFMPAEGRPALRAEEIAWIKAWIQQGASPTNITVAGISIRDERPELPLQPVGDYSALMPEIRQMQQTQGAKLMQVSSKP